MSDDFHFGLNKNKVPTKASIPANDCIRTRWYGYLRRIAKEIEQEKFSHQ